MSIITGWFSVQFAGIWQMVWTFGIGGAVIVACIALYALQPVWLSKVFPNIQKVLLWVAAITLAIMISISIGVHLGEKRVQAQWDAARAVSLKKAKGARAAGVRDAARKPSRWLPNKRDPDLRD